MDYGNNECADADGAFKAAFKRERSDACIDSVEREQARPEVKDVQEGSSNEWLEPVTDEVYNKLK